MIFHGFFNGNDKFGLTILQNVNDKYVFPIRFHFIGYFSVCVCVCVRLGLLFLIMYYHHHLVNSFSLIIYQFAWWVLIWSNLLITIITMKCYNRFGNWLLENKKKLRNVIGVRISALFMIVVIHLSLIVATIYQPQQITNEHNKLSWQERMKANNKRKKKINNGTHFTFCILSHKIVVCKGRKKKIEWMLCTHHNSQTYPLVLLV